MARKKRPPSYGILLVPLVGILILTLTLVILYAIRQANSYYFDWQIEQRIAQIPNVDMEKSKVISLDTNSIEGHTVATEMGIRKVV